MIAKLVEDMPTILNLPSTAAIAIITASVT